MKQFLVVDDHPMMQISLQLLLKEIFEGCNVHMTASFQDSLARLDETNIDLIVLDLGIPGSAGVDMIKQLRERQPEVRILVFSARDESMNAPIYLRAGANGFLHKMSSQDEIRTALKTVINDKKYVSSQLQAQMLEALTSNKAIDANSYDGLSPREKEVLHKMLDGDTIKEISESLRMKQSTVSTYKERIMQKMEATNIVDLVRKTLWYID
ncbi:response regulator [Dyadobacter fermentans]|nr:response regulator transcription factor [Dyadobacter fermentans]